MKLPKYNLNVKSMRQHLMNYNKGYYVLVADPQSYAKVSKVTGFNLICIKEANDENYKETMGEPNAVLLSTSENGRFLTVEEAEGILKAMKQKLVTVVCEPENSGFFKVVASSSTACINDNGEPLKLMYGSPNNAVLFGHEVD